MREVSNYINGVFTASSQVSDWQAVHRSDNGKVCAQVQDSNEKETQAAVAAAHKALPAWRQLSALKRARILFKFLQLFEAQRENIATLLAVEHGKTIEDADGEIARGLEVIEYACGIPHLLKGEYSENVGTNVDSYAIRQPMGVCAGVTPFNFPVMVPMWMWPVALACGNTFVLKPSALDPSSANEIAKLLKAAGLPDGVFNVVHGNHVPVNTLLTDPRVAAVSFVGSTPVAQHIYSTGAKHGKRVQALGGAKNHAVVMPDSDLDSTANALIGAAFGSAGERCMAISVVVAVGDVGDKLVTTLKQKIQTLKVGKSTDKGLDMGPLISKAHQEKVKNYIDTGVQEGASLILDGRKQTVKGNEAGYFVFPTLFDHIKTDMTIYQEEIFGPVLSVLRVDTVQQAIELINGNRYANGVAIFTKQGHAAREFVQRIEVGMVGVNVPIPVPTAYHSFGGWRDSIFGGYGVHGMEGVRFYTRLKTATSRWQENASRDAQFYFPVND